MTAAPALKGIKVSTGAEGNNAPLIIVEGKKEGRNTVLTQITISSDGKQAAPLAEGSVFTGTFEGIKTVPAQNGYPSKSYVSVRSADGSLVQIKMGKSLQDAMAQAENLGLAEGDLVQIEYAQTVALEGGRTFFKFNVQI